MKYIFIANETAGRGKCKKVLPNIEEANKYLENEVLNLLRK